MRASMTLATLVGLTGLACGGRNPNLCSGTDVDPSSAFVVQGLHWPGEVTCVASRDLVWQDSSGDRTADTAKLVDQLLQNGFQASEAGDCNPMVTSRALVDATGTVWCVETAFNAYGDYTSLTVRQP